LSVDVAPNKNMGLCYNFVEFIVWALRVQILCLLTILYHRISMFLLISIACSHKCSDFIGIFSFKT
jgi:hypothetical protein